MVSSKKGWTLAFVLFIFLFVYLILRAVLLEPLNDELLTLFYYIETGEIIGPNAFPDANNHLLISFWGRLMYQLGGSDFFWYRIPSLLGFVLYFWGTYRLISQRKQEISWTSLIAFGGIVSIPFVLEYFAYARGYGISLGCFVWVIVEAIKIQDRIKMVPLLVLFSFMLIAISANLSMIILGLLLLLWVLFQQVIYWRQYKIRYHIAIIAICCLFGIGLLPFIEISFDLREKGLLYYGSLNGLWLETGKSLSLYTFFKNPVALKWIWSAVFIGLFVLLIKWFLQEKKEFFRNKVLIFPWFIFGALASMVIMAELLGVNYPSDRTAMYLIPLVFIFIVLVVEQFKYLKYLNVCFGLFMISFSLNFSFNSSIFSPEDRLNGNFYNEIREKISSGTTISCSPVMAFTWPYAERKQDGVLIYNPYKESELSDIVVVSVRDERTNFFDSEYEVFANDPKKMLKAYRRKNALKRTPIASLKSENKMTSDEFIPLFSLDSIDSIRAKDLIFDFSCEISTDKPIQKLMLVIAVDDSLTNVRYHATELNWYCNSDRKMTNINFPWIMSNKSPNENAVKLYLWNLGRNEVRLENLQIEIRHLHRKEKN